MLKIKVGDARYAVSLQGSELICVVERPLKHYCGGKMLLHDIGAWHRALNGYALDIHLKCLRCHEYTTHGIPGELLESDEPIEKYCGKIVSSFELSDETREVVKRLESWGYWALLISLAVGAWLVI